MRSRLECPDNSLETNEPFCRFSYGRAARQYKPLEKSDLKILKINISIANFARAGYNWTFVAGAAIKSEIQGK